MTNPLSQVYAGTSPASSVSQAIGLNNPALSTPNNTAKSDRFWATDNQPVSSTNQEVLEMDFSTASLTNRISFQAAKFPQTIQIEYSVDTSNNWYPAIDYVTGQPIEIVLLGSFPAVLPAANIITGHVHPQHDYDNHWQDISLNIVPQNMQKLRFVLQRNPSGQPPVDLTGVPVPYSLALQDIYVGYEITSKGDVPRTILEDASNSSGTVFANSTDIFGSNLGFSTKTRYASNLLGNTDQSAPSIWKCEPQPFPNAVVNFYADLRDANGDAQVIDRIFIDPLYDGSHITLYFSNDDENENFLTSREALNGNQAQFSNASIDGNNNIFLGNYGDVSFVQIDNTYLSFDPSNDWWLGAEFTLGYAQSVDGVDHTLFSSNLASVGVNSTGVYFRTSGGDVNLIPITLDSLNPIQVVAAYHDNILHLSVQQLGIVTTADLPTTIAISSILPSQLYIGTNTPHTHFLNSVVSAFVLKQETWVDDSFLNDPQSFSRVPSFDSPSDVGRQNGLLRYDPTLTSITSPTGLIGGPAFTFESMNWTPIPREYEMHRGVMELPVTKAKFWNLEITNLRPEYSEKYVPATRNIKTFPPSVMSQYNPAKDAGRSSPGDLATNIQSSLSNVMSFSDIPSVIGTGGNANGVSSTAVYVSNDYATNQRLQLLGTQWQYTQWHAERIAPRFNVAGPHIYSVQAITQKTNISYFTGLRNIQFSRSVSTSPQDFAFIEETFVDGQGVNEGNWTLHPEGGLYSGKAAGGSYSRTRGVVAPTQRAIRGIQFAAQQTDAKEININGEFDDPSYTADQVPNWSRFGDGKILGLVETTSGGDTSLMVSRQTNVGFWGDISLNYVTWGGLKTGNGFQSGTETIQFPTTNSNVVLAHLGIQQSTILVLSSDESVTYALGTDYTLSATDASLPDSQTTIHQVSTGTIPTVTNITVLYSYADAAHPTNVKYSDLKAGINGPSLDGGIQSQAIALPTGGRIHAAARVTATQALTEPLWIQILDANTGGVLAEAESNVGKNEVKEWYSTIDIGDYGAQNGLKWSDLVGAHVWPSFSDAFTRANSPILGAMDSGQSWVTPVSGTQLQIVSNVAKAIATGNCSQIDLKTPWGVLDVTIGTAVTTGTHSAAVPVIDLGGTFVMNDSTVMTNNTSATVMTLTTTLANSVRYRFKFMPTNAVPVGQTVAGADPVARPYSLLVFTRNNDTPTATETWVQTLSSNRSFGTVRGLMGATNQTFTYFHWTPTNVQVNMKNQQLTMPIPTSSALVLQDSFSGSNQWQQTPTKSWQFTGYFTYGTSFLNTTMASLDPTGESPLIPGTMAVTDVIDQYGAMEFNVTQIASGLTAANQSIAYLNWNPVSGLILTLQADGTIKNQTTGSTVKTSMFASATAGPITVHYAPAQFLSSGFKTTWSVTGSQAMIFLQSNAVVGVYSGTGIWDTTVRGLGGANDGAVTSGHYTIMEGFSWNPDASLLALNTGAVTWANVTYGNTRTYGQMTLNVAPSVQQIYVRLIQKNPSLDYWFTESVAVFWDPVIWEFSCDSGVSYWRGEEIRNNPNGVLLFPYSLTNYTNLVWRVSSYADDVYINNLVIRPWYVGLHGGIPSRPTQLPQGPNTVPSDHYGPIADDPRWQVWDLPIPRSWWFNFKKAQTI